MPFSVLCTSEGSVEPLALLGRQRISEAGIEAGTLEGACDRLDCSVRSSGRPLPAGRDSVREEPGRGKLGLAPSFQ